MNKKIENISFLLNTTKLKSKKILLCLSELIKSDYRLSITKHRNTIKYLKNNDIIKKDTNRNYSVHNKYQGYLFTEKGKDFIWNFITLQKNNVILEPNEDIFLLQIQILNRHNLDKGILSIPLQNIEGITTSGELVISNPKKDFSSKGRKYCNFTQIKKEMRKYTDTPIEVDMNRAGWSIYFSLYDFLFQGIDEHKLIFHKIIYNRKTVLKETGLTKTELNSLLNGGYPENMNSYSKKIRKSCLYIRKQILKNIDRLPMSDELIEWLDKRIPKIQEPKPKSKYHFIYEYYEYYIRGLLKQSFNGYKIQEVHDAIYLNTKENGIDKNSDILEIIEDFERRLEKTIFSNLHFSISF